MVTTNKQPLEDQVKAFKSSSAFTPGDALSFSIKINNLLSLPGRHDPAAYMGSLMNELSGKVAVICPGNGGLCIEALRRGAESVAAFEPRSVYHKALSKIAEFYQEANGRTFGVNNSRLGLNQASFDTIFWTEGLDEIQNPEALFDDVLAALKPGGRLFIEVSHGNHGPMPKVTNSWKPSIASFESTIKKVNDLSITSKKPGRNQLRIIYEIKRSAPVPAEVVTAPKTGGDTAVIVPTGEEAQALFGDASTAQSTDAEAPKKRGRKPKPTPPAN